jgi:CheY-like chemotaxis protein
LTSAVDETSPVSPDSTSGSWALLVESSSTGQIALLPVLEKQGLRCLLASSGREAIALLERFELDFVILCLEPSTMDGLEASG